MMSWTKGKSSGWASFDLKHRQKQDFEPGVNRDPYPPKAKPVSSVYPCHLYPCQTFGRNTDLEFPTLTEKKDSRKPTQVENASRKHGDNGIEDHCGRLAFENLKELHSWADNILVAVNNDIDKASALLKAMGSAGSFNDDRESVNVELGSTSKDPLHDGITFKSSSASEDYSDHNKEMSVDYPFYKNKYREDPAGMDGILRHLSSIPIEPEYAEEDIYLSHRKDALKAMRSASQHSRAATSAYLRGDHFSAQQHSAKAREERMAAERLNVKAAEEILRIRNSNNDSWKLDLHGLHAAEAIQALKQHLWKIENKIPSKPSILLNGDKTGDGIVLPQSRESSSSVDMDKLYGNQISSRQTPVSLQVITGRGNHSRGQAALPIAVRSFLNENGYRFNETRPGMITVMPKFRYHRVLN